MNLRKKTIVCTILLLFSSGQVYAKQISDKDEKTVPIGTDVLGVDDSEDGNALKKVQLSNLPISMATQAAIDALEGQIPDVTSDLTNDSGFLTSETDPNVNALGKATLDCSDEQIPKWNGTTWACADYTDAPSDGTSYGRLNGAWVNVLQSYTETDPVFIAWDKDYEDLTNTPTIYSVSDGVDIVFTGNPLTPTLVATGVPAGTYNSVTVDLKGRVTAGTSTTSSSGIAGEVTYSDEDCTVDLFYRDTASGKIVQCVVSGDLDNYDGTNWDNPEPSANVWDDTLASSDTGWTYNGDNTWTCDGTNGGIYINDLVENGSTADFVIEIISVSAGLVRGKLEGSPGTDFSTVGTHNDTIVDTLNFSLTGLQSVGFVGTVQLHSIIVQ